MMKKFDVDSLLKAIEKIEKGYFKFDKDNYKIALTLTKRAAKASGLSLRNITISKKKNIKTPGIVIPIHCLILDNGGDEEIYIQVLFIQVEKMDENFCECSLVEYNKDKITSDNTGTFQLDNIEKLKKFKKLNNSFKIKPVEFMYFLSALYNEFYFSIPKTVLSNSIGWQPVFDSYQYYPVVNKSIEKQEGDFLNNIYASEFDLRKYIARTTFLNYRNLSKKSDGSFDQIKTSFIETKTDMLLFSITIYSFCRKFFMLNESFTPFSIFVHSNKPNSYVWKYVSFWVDLFVPIDDEKADWNDQLELVNDKNHEVSKGVKRTLLSHSDAKAQEYRKPVPYNKIKQLSEIKDKDIPIIIKNPSTKTKNKKALISKNDIDILNQCKVLPVLIQPEGSEILPPIESFIIADINDKREEKDLSLLGVKKDQLLSLYHGFIVYLNGLGNKLISTLDFAYQCALNDLKSQNITLAGNANHYVYLWASAYLFSYCMKPTDQYGYSEEQNIFTKKSRKYFMNMIKEVSNYKPVIQLSQCFELFKSFIRKAVKDSMITQGEGSLEQDLIGWIEIVNAEENLYLKDNYYSHFINYCEEMDLQLKYTPKYFHKHVLAERNILVPQYLPNSPEAYIRYDVYKKVHGEKIKTIRIDLKKLNT